MRADQVAKYVWRLETTSTVSCTLSAAGPLFADPRPSRTPHRRHGQRESIPPRIIQQTSAPIDKIVGVRNRPLSYFQTSANIDSTGGGASTSKAAHVNLVDNLCDLDPDVTLLQ